MFLNTPILLCISPKVHIQKMDSLEQILFRLSQLRHPFLRRTKNTPFRKQRKKHYIVLQTFFSFSSRCSLVIDEHKKFFKKNYNLILPIVSGHYA